MEVEDIIRQVKEEKSQERDAELAMHQGLNLVLDKAFELLNQPAMRQYECHVDRTSSPSFVVRRFGEDICTASKESMIQAVMLDVMMDTETLESYHVTTSTLVTAVIKLLEEHKEKARRPTNY